MEVSLKGIIFKDGKEFEVTDDVQFYMNLVDFSNVDLESILFINLIHIFHTEYTILQCKEELISEIKRIDGEKKVKCLVYILNETCINDTSEFDEISDRLDINYFVCNYDLNYINKDNHLFYPASLSSQIEYLNDNDFIPAIPFLENMNNQFHNLQKPFRCAFYSKHINPIRIDIFNLLKKYDVLKESTWSFHKLEEYYSRERHDLDEFYKENEGLIPYSFDYYSDDRSNLKHTYFSQWLCYFEILTESYFLKQLKNKNDYCPMTEKIAKPIVSGLPFIIFCPKKLKSGLEDIGMTFESPLYGFYDISDDEDIQKGLNHIEKQISMTKEELHKTYFEYTHEYHNNIHKFMEFFEQNAKSITKSLESIG